MAGSNRRKGKLTRMLWCASQAGLVAGAGVALPQAAQAQAAGAQVAFEIPAGPLAEALRRYSETTGVQLVYSSALVEGRLSPGVSGAFSKEEALQRILAGSNLSARFAGNTATIEGVGGGDRILGAVRVEGAQGSPYFGGAGQTAGVNGINGSRDVTATEGTGSFTSGALTVGSKAPQAIKDVPQSLSVLTSERMKQQNVTDFTTAMRQLPGISLVQGNSSLESVFYSRGFKIDSIQIDGGAPLSTSFNFFPQIDLSQYDHVELLRGAAGLLNGYGDPSGTVNLVRKKPLDHAQFTFEAQAGSWDNYRVVADATSPLALDGKLRGRVVMTYQDQDHFYDTAKDNKTLIYGIAELDVTPRTLVTAGVSYTRQDSVPWLGGLPRYQTGADLKLPRSTSLALPWSRWAFDTIEIFGSIDQKIGTEWIARLNVTYNDQKSQRKIGFGTLSVNPLNNRGPIMAGSYDDTASEQLAAEAVLTGAFELFGQRQEITIGANHVNSNGGGLTIYGDFISTYPDPYQPYPGGPIYCQDFGMGTCPPGSILADAPPVNVFTFNPYDVIYTEPRNPLPSERYPRYGEIQSGAYMNLRLTAFERLHLTTGLRWSRYEIETVQEYLCTRIPEVDPGYSPSCFGKQIGDVYSNYSDAFKDDDFSWPPPVNLSFDLTEHLTAYVGYTDIYESQARYLDSDRNPLDPITGSNVEAGLKWAGRDGRYNLSVAVYRIEKKGFAEEDDRYPPYEQIGPSTYCCFLSDPNHIYESRGLDIDVSGEILSGWQLAASYAYNKNRYKGSSFGTDEGLPFTSIQPEHIYKLWTSYDFGAAGKTGWLSGLTLSGGINGQSSAYYAGSVCVNLNEPDPVTHKSTCRSSSEPDTVPFEFIVPGYAVFSTRIDYRFSPAWWFAVNLENIFDKTYYQTVGETPSRGNWYGAPRSVTVSLRAKW